MTLKNPKRLAIVALTAFLAFAPPGTMIFLGALLVGLVGGRWAAAVAVCLGVGAVAAFFFVRRRRLRLRRQVVDEHDDGDRKRD
jgi:uncharacterized membrane protein YdjX (TVP38/TMEM64 family)